MIEDYDSFSCMLSVLHHIENLNKERIRSKKELYEHMRSLIELLCKDRESRMYFVSMSGERGGKCEIMNECMNTIYSTQSHQKDVYNYTI